MKSLATIGGLCVGSALLASALTAAIINGTASADAEQLDAHIDTRITHYLQQQPRQIYNATVAAAKVVAQELQQEHARVQSGLIAEATATGNAPVLGNPDASTTLVMFSDYRCGYCKKSHPEVAELLATNPDVRVVIRELPVLGKPSLEAARVALAVHAVAPEHYAAFQDALFAGTGRDNWNPLVAAEELGVNPQALAAQVAKSSELDEQLALNASLADGLQIDGTPAFVIGDSVYRGALDGESLRQLIDAQQARG